MAKFVKKGQQSPYPHLRSMALKFHPLKVFVYLTLAGISSAFLFVSIAYLITTYGTNFNNFKLPFIFHANSLIILVSSYTMAQSRKAAMADDLKGYVNGLLVTGGLGLGFAYFQVTGWEQLMDSGIRLGDNIAGDYIYFLTGLHLLHLVVGILLLGWFALQGLEMRADPVKALLFESNPLNKMRVSVLGTYWHFVDALWLYLYGFILLNTYLAKALPLIAT